MICSESTRAFGQPSETKPTRGPCVPLRTRGDISDLFIYKFSDPRQASGSIAGRQADCAKYWAAGCSKTLDDTLSPRDEGLSSFRQRDVKQRGLGIFVLGADTFSVV